MVTNKMSATARFMMRRLVVFLIWRLKSGLVTNSILFCNSSVQSRISVKKCVGYHDLCQMSLTVSETSAPTRATHIIVSLFLYSSGSNAQGKKVEGPRPRCESC